MKKNSSNSGFLARFLKLNSSLMGGKNFFVKFMFIIIIGVFTINFGVSILFGITIFLFVGIASLAGDKDAERLAKKADKGIVSFAKYAISGDLGDSLSKSIVDTAVKAVKGKLDVELRDQHMSIADISLLKEYFKLLNIKNKKAIKLVKSDGGPKVLKNYRKTYGSVDKLSDSIAKEKAVKKAFRKKAKKARKAVKSATSWSTSPQ